MDTAVEAYDVVIVGSGSTGGALAARLSEDASRSVLLLEGGPVYRSVDEMPADLLSPAAISAAVPGHPNNWAYPAEQLPGIRYPYPRGKGLGGSSSINGCYFIRGTRADFDLWARLGNDEWTYEDVLPYYRRGESDLDFSGEYHGSDGPIPVRREPHDRAPEFTSAFTAGCTDLGFAEDPDKNVPNPDGGVGPVPMNIANGRRMGTALGYLIPAMGRSNLRIVGNAVVHRVVLDGTRAVGVEALVEGTPTVFRSDEVVISAGALRSPQILMLSGIGPERHLREHGIPVVQHLAGVGQDLTDHPMVMAPWDAKVNFPNTPDRGPLTSLLHWRAEDAELEVLPFVTTSGDMLGASELLTSPTRALNAVRGSSVKALTREAKMMRYPRVAIVCLEADSRGTVTLTSADPGELPVSRWNLLTSERDRARLREAVRVADEIWHSAPMREIGAKIVGLSRKILGSRSGLDDWISQQIGTGHPSSTCKMGPASDESAVVDQRLRVYGIEGLRVADTSAFPRVPTRGPNATAMMLGERLADMMAGASVAQSAPDAADTVVES